MPHRGGSGRPASRPSAKKEIYDMRMLRERDKIIFNMSEEENQPLGQRYKDALMKLGVCMTEGGTRLANSGVTFYDNKNPLCKFRIIAFYGGEDVSTTFLVTMPNVFFEGYSLDDFPDPNNPEKQPIWYMCRGTKFKLTNCTSKHLPFKMNYKEEQSIPNDCYFMRRGQVGANIFPRALSLLRNGTEKQRHYAFQTICVHFAEYRIASTQI